MTFDYIYKRQSVTAEEVSVDSDIPLETIDTVTQDEYYVTITTTVQLSDYEKANLDETMKFRGCVFDRMEEVQ